MQANTAVPRTLIAILIALFTLPPLLIGEARAQEDIFDRLDELCAAEQYDVTTNEEGGDPTRSGYLSNWALCFEEEPCTLRAALSSAAYCANYGPKTVVLQAEGPNVLTRRNEPHPFLKVHSRATANRAGPVALPHIVGDVLISGNDQIIEVNYENAEPVEYDCEEQQDPCIDVGRFRLFHILGGAELWTADLTLRSARAWEGKLDGFTHDCPSKPPHWCDGGAVLNEGTLIANDTEFVGNGALAGVGGAVANRFDGTYPVLAGFDHALLSAGIAQTGTAIFNDQGTVSIYDTVVEGHHGPFGPYVLVKLIESRGGSLELVRTTVLDNEQGTITQIEGEPNIAESLLKGGYWVAISALEIIGAQARISASTVTDNHTTFTGSGPSESTV